MVITCLHQLQAMALWNPCIANIHTWSIGLRSVNFMKIIIQIGVPICIKTIDYRVPEYRNWPRYGGYGYGVVGTAIRHSTSCACRRAVPAGTTSAVPHCSTTHDSADRISGQFLFYHDYKKQEKLAFSTSWTAVRPHRRLRHDAWRQDS